MMNKNYYELTFIFIYIAVISFFTYEIFNAGISNIKLYQVLLLGVLIFSLVDRIRTFLKNKKED